jgi:dihydroxyacetone kinase
LYGEISIFFSGLAQGLQGKAPTSGEVTSETWGQALSAALANLYTYTRARPPSRTLVDPLSVFIQTLVTSGNNFEESVAASVTMAEATRDFSARAGRSAYVEGDRLKKERIPDPGAWGVKTILENLVV